MFHSKRLHPEIDYSEESSEHSKVDNMHSIDDFQEWARKKQKRTKLDPKKRKPIEVNHLNNMMAIRTIDIFIYI